MPVCSGRSSRNRYRSVISSMWMLGRVWLPPNTVIRPLISACMVNMSRRHRAAAAAKIRKPSPSYDLYNHIVLVRQHNPLAAHFGVVVFRDRQQFEIFGNLLFILDPVHASRRRVDEALDALAPGATGELHGGEATDELWIEVSARIVRDTRQMNDRVDASRVDFVWLAH